MEIIDTCPECGKKQVRHIDVSQQSDRLNPRVTDIPYYGQQLTVALPAYLCGHTYRVVMKPFKREDGKYEYRCTNNNEE